jgi:hypothetical protein
VLGAGFVGSLLNAASRYEKPLMHWSSDSVCPVYQNPTYLNNQDLNSLFGFFSRLRGGGKWQVS